MLPLLALLLAAANDAGTPDVDAAGWLATQGHPGAVFHRDGTVCLAFTAGSDGPAREPQPVWSQRWEIFTAGGHSQLTVDRPPFDALSERCGESAKTFAELSSHACTGRLGEVLASATTLALHLPDPGPVVTPALHLPSDRLLDFANEDFGCAWSVSAPDGRLRVWTVTRAHPADGSSQLVRGEAYLQWSDRKGVHVWRDLTGGRDLLLDSALDLVAPLDGERWLIGGWGPLNTDNQRFLEVITLGGSGPERVSGAFVVAGKPRDVLMLTGPRPDTSHARHSLIFNFTAQYDAAAKAITFAPRPNLMPALAAFVKNESPVTLATFDGRRFTADLSKWGAVTLSK